jgi:hypothetical protein
MLNTILAYLIILACAVAAYVSLMGGVEVPW